MVFILLRLCGNYRIVGNFRVRKLLWISWFCGYSQKFLREILGHGIHWHGKWEQSAKVFSMKIVFSPIHKSFSLESFPPYSSFVDTTSLKLHSSKATKQNFSSNSRNWLISTLFKCVLDGTVIVQYVATLKTQPKEMGWLLQSENFLNFVITAAWYANPRCNTVATATCTHFKMLLLWFLLRHQPIYIAIV